jgi:PAS domain S-box-containing protein
MKNELSREKALLDALMNNLPDFIFFKDKDSKFIRISKSMLPLFPVDTLEEMIGKSDFDFHQPDAAKEMYNEEQEIIRTEKGFKDKTQHEITETGKEQWVSVTKLPLYDENGKLIGTFGISKDITQFKKLEIESREKNEKLEKKVEELNAYQQEASIKESENRGLAEVVNSIMWKAELDNEGNMLSANNLFLDNTGYNSDELVGKNIGEILADRDREDLRDILEKIKQNTTQKIELNVNAKSGEVLNLFVSLIPVMADKDNALQKIILLGNNNSHSALG